VNDKPKAPPSTGRRNREAPRLNPEKSGIRSGNPQLEPDSGPKTPRRDRGDAPHSPRAEPE
jgi:hypothetical protein